MMMLSQQAMMLSQQASSRKSLISGVLHSFLLCIYVPQSLSLSFQALGPFFEVRRVFGTGPISTAFSCKPVGWRASSSQLFAGSLSHATKDVENPRKPFLDDDEDNNNIVSFTSQPMQLYIEDTDAYGVMYNGNYIKSYERALHEFHTNVRSSDCDAKKYPQQAILSQHSDFYLTKCTGHKFKSSPPLGSQYVIKGTFVNDRSKLENQIENSNDGPKGVNNEETWNLEMIEYKGEDNEDDKPPKVYNTATVTITSPTKLSMDINSFTTEIGGDDYATERLPLLAKSFTVHRDEFDVHIPGAIPISTTLKLMERLRSDALGGPDKLRQMQIENNLLWVVTSIDDLQVDSRNSIQPGDEVLVRMYTSSKRKGMIVTCDQEILTNSRTSENKEGAIVLAKGTVTLCAIDSVKGRPTSKIPDEVRKLFQ